MKGFLAVIVVIVLIILGVVLFKPKQTPPQPVQPQTNPEKSMTSTAVKEFNVNGKNFSFDPSQITVKKGDKVKITFKDEDGFHNLVISGYNVETKKINTGQEQTVEFIADKTGQFEYYCSVTGHREKGMKGTLTVN